MAAILSRVGGLGIRAVVAREPSRLEDRLVALFGEMRAPVIRYLVSLRIPSADAEEIVQEVFLLLFRHLNESKPCPNPQGWIFRAAHIYALKHRERSRKDVERFSGLADDASVADRFSPNPEETVQAIEHRNRLMAVVRAMPEQDQCCLSLRAEGLTYRDIAAVLGISLGSVANSLERSLARLARAVAVAADNEH